MATAMPPALKEASKLYYQSQQKTARRTATEVQNVWRNMEGQNFTDKWNWFNAVAIPAITQSLRTGQAKSLESTMQYLRISAMVQGIDPDILLGWDKFISDPDTIARTLTVPMAAYTSETISGRPENSAKASALYSLTTIASTAVQDAGRDAMSTAVLATPEYSGYVRQISTPACQRCIVLAGKWFEDYTPFDRHPNCDCLHVPSTDRYEDTDDPYDAIEKGLVTDLSKADTKAILEHNADISQVINAKKGMYTESLLGQQVQATYTGTSKRGTAGRRLGNFQKTSGSKYTKSSTRLTVGQIMKFAGDDKEHAQRLLFKHGYVL